MELYEAPSARLGSRIPGINAARPVTGVSFGHDRDTRSRWRGTIVVDARAATAQDSGTETTEPWVGDVSDI